MTIDVALSLPDGSVRTYAIPEPSPGTAVIVLELLPGEPIGLYEATATQGDLQVDRLVSRPSGRCSRACMRSRR